MRNLTVFFVLSLIFVSFSADLSPEKTVLPVLEEEKQNLVTLLSASTNSTYVIDDVLALLQSLLDDSTQQLADLETQWNEDYPEIEQTFNNISNIIENMKTICQGYWDVASEINDTITTTSSTMQEYQDIISKNQKRLDTLQDSRCQTNQNYILGLVKNKNALALIAMLRQAIEQFTEQNLLQLGMNKLNSVAEVISHLARKDRSFMNLIQQLVPNVPDVSERTSEEIGTGYIDNDQDEITVSTFDSKTLEAFQGIKTRLLNLLDSLEQTIETDMTTSQANELNSTETMADFELSIETENKIYLNLIKNLTTQLNETMEKFIVAWNDYESCETEYNSWEQTFSVTQQNLKNASDYYQSKKQQFQDMIDLFTSIYDYYKEQIYSASDEYKQRADDYIDDQTFDTTSDFTKRSADEYNSLSGSVQSSTYDEAATSSLSQLKTSKAVEKEEEEEKREEILKRAETLKEKIRNLIKFRA